MGGGGFGRLFVSVCVCGDFWERFCECVCEWL